MVAISASNSFFPTPSFAAVSARAAATITPTNQQAPQQQNEARGGPAVQSRSLISTDLTLALQGGSDSENSININQVNDEEKAQIEALRARDREVRAHERAHATAGAGIAGAPSFTFERGPDGVQYAVEGEVAIDTSSVPGDTEGSIAKLEQVIRAATAPAEPSGQDRAVAAQAQAQLAQLRADALAERQAEQSGEADEDAPEGSSEASQSAISDASNQIVNLLGAI